MSASIGGTGMGLPHRGAIGRPGTQGRYRRPAERGLRRRWERALTWWVVIGLCTAFWYGVLHLAGAV